VAGQKSDLPQWAKDAIVGFERGADWNRKMSARALPLGLLVGIISGLAFFFISHRDWSIAIFELVFGTLIFVVLFRYAGRRGVRMAQGQIDSVIALAHKRSAESGEESTRDGDL
jgi:hypothetical protein